MDRQEPSEIQPREILQREPLIPLAKRGGLAYKALRNYQEGKPLMQGVPGLEQLTAAPERTVFSEQACGLDKPY